MTGPLDGLLVIELGTAVAPAFCGRLLAGFGATVVKVEPPHGDPSRRARVVPGAPVPDPDRAPLFAYLSMGKRSHVGDPADAIGRADVVIDDGVPSRYDALCARNPALVYTSLTPFGTWGPYAGRTAENITVFAMGGQMALTGEPDREPLCTAGEQAWYQLGLAGFAATCVALFERERSGLGQHVDVAGMEVLATQLEGFGPTARSAGAPTPRTGTHRFSLMGIYPCADGHAGIFAMPRQLPILAALLDRPDLPDQFRVTSAEELLKRAEELKDIIGAFFDANTRDDLLAIARETKLPMAPVRSVAEVAASEHLAARGFFADVAGMRVPGAPVRLPAAPWRSGDAPALGELDDLAILSGRGPGRRSEVRPPALEGLREVPLATRADGPLSGVRVLDFTQYWLGPFCTKWLADFGADVIRVESPQRMDFVRTIVASREQDRWWDRSAYFNNYNRGKRSLSVDPAHPEGRAVILDLVAQCDVVAENFAAGYMARIGLPYDALRERRADLIMLSASGYGMHGPDSALAGVGTNMEQLSGIASLNQYLDVAQPYNTGIAYGDPTGGTIATAAVLMALMHRDRTGLGQHIDLSAHEVLVSLIGEHLAAHSLGISPAPKGNAHPDMVPHGCYPCEGDDRWVTVAMRDDARWPALCELIGRSDLAALATLEQRREQAYEIDIAITTWTVVRSDVDAAGALRAISVAAGPVLTPNDLPDDPHTALRGTYVTVDDPDQGPWPHDGVVWRMGRTPGSVRASAPRFAQHTRDILRELLGYDDARIGALYACGAAADAPTR